MISRYDVILNNVHMATLSKKLLVLDVQYQTPKYTMQTESPAGTDAIVVGERKKEKAVVVVTFELHIYDIAKRQAALQKVISWCRNGGTLEVNDRPNQQMTVACDRFPSLGSVRNWTDPLTIEFAGYSSPYWEDDTETVVTLQGTNVGGTINVPGTADSTPFAVEVTTTKALSKASISVTVGSNTITLSEVTCPANTKITFGHSEKGILTIKQGSTSILAKRTGSSADDLTAKCGGNRSIKVLAPSKVTAVFKTRGRWL